MSLAARIAKLTPKFLVFAAVLSSAAVAGAQEAQPSASRSAGPVVVIVRVATPWYAPRSVVASTMRDTQAEYAGIAGLAFKAYSFERASGDYGGVYFWRDRASAEAWFNEAWHQRVRKERGSDALVRYFDAPVSLDNSPGGTPANSDSQSVATLVEIPIPAGISRERLEAEYQAAIPVYQKVPGLLRKHFIVTDRKTFGGVYLWRDDASAKAWFTPAWHQRVKATYGQEARIEWFDTPILLPTRTGVSLAGASSMVVAAP